jgi:hypothetical protein
MIYNYLYLLQLKIPTMKKAKAIILGITISIGIHSYAQVSEPYGSLLFEDTLSLDPIHEWITIPSQESNIWQVGRSNKGILSESNMQDAVLITDTLESYPASIDNYFLISIPENENSLSWPEGILSFHHKYQTDSLNDGCIIEISYDYGQSWKNILYDDVHINNHFTGLYSDADTIVGGIPAFSGSTSTWIYTEFHWRWMALLKSSISEQTGQPILRFRFVSDDNNSGKDGWAINRIVFRGYDISGTVEERFNNIANIYPNPVSDLLNIEIPIQLDDLDFNLYTPEGRLQISEVINKSQVLDLSHLSKGLYFYTLSDKGLILDSGKLVKR